MAIDASIALQGKAPQFENPLDTYTRLAQLQHYQSQNKLADLMYGEKQRTIDDDMRFRSALSGAMGPDGKFDTSKSGDLYSASPTQAASFIKSQQEAKNAQLAQAKAGLELIKLRAPSIMANPTMEYANAVLDEFEGLGLNMAKDRAVLQASQGDPEVIKRWAMGHGIEAEKLLPKFEKVDTGGSVKLGTFDPMTNQYTTRQVVQKTQSPDSIASTNATIRGQNMVDERQRELNNTNQEFQKSELVKTTNGFSIVDKRTGASRPVSSPDGTQLQQADSPQYLADKQAGQLSEAIKLARKLLPDATGSGAGAVIDKAMRFVGKSTDGDKVSSQLETIAGWMVSNVPRMEGPQSDQDRLLYLQMAAQVGDRTIPVETRLAALDTLEQLQNKYSTLRKGRGASDSWGDNQNPQEDSKNDKTLNNKPQAYAELPAPGSYAGKVARDQQTGKRYRSDGKQWIEVQ